MSSLMNHVRLGIVIALCVVVVTYKNICIILVKITQNVDMFGTCMDPYTPYKYQITEFFYMSILLKCIDITINYKTAHCML